VSVPPTASTPRTGELQQGRIAPRVGAILPLAGPPGRPTPPRCIRRFEGCRGAGVMSRKSFLPAGHVFTHNRDANLRFTLPLHLLDCDSARKIANPATTRQPGYGPAETGGSPGGWETAAPALRREPSTWLGLREAQG
jgi:hypothetical protein